MLTSAKLALLALAVLLLPLPAQAICPSSPAIQVLGSGGPDSQDARASSGYVLWVGDEARLLIDAGGGIFLRFGQAKARFEDLDAIAITHLHADHVADLIAILKSGFFSSRERPLPVVGPTGNETFPSMSEFMQILLNETTGAYRYLSGYLDGSGGVAKLEIKDFDARSEQPQTVFSNDRFKLTAIGVKHGPVPALGYVIEIEGKKIAISGDQNRDNPAFARLAHKSDVLIMDHAIGDAADEVGANLHTRPADVGALAESTEAARLVLSHNMSRSLETLSANLASIRIRYHGPIDVAEDLTCLEMDATGRH